MLLENHIRPIAQKEIQTADLRLDIPPKLKTAPFLPERDIPPATLEQIFRDLSDHKKRPLEISGLDFRSHWNLIALTILFPEMRFPEKFQTETRRNITLEVQQNRIKALIKGLNKARADESILCQSIGTLAYKLEYQKLLPDLGLKSKYLKRLQQKLNQIIAGNDGPGWDEIIIMIKLLFPENSSEHVFPKNIHQLTFRQNEKILDIIENFWKFECLYLFSRKAAALKLIYPEQFSEQIKLTDDEWQKIKLEMNGYKARSDWPTFLNIAMNLAILGADKITLQIFCLSTRNTESSFGFKLF